MRRTFTTALVLTLSVLGVGDAASSAQSGNTQPSASDKVHETLSNLARSIGNSGVEMYLSGTEFSHEQAQDPHMPILTVPAKERFLLAPDGRYLLQTEEHYPGGIVFRFRTVGSKAGAKIIDELKWRTGNEITAESPQQAKQDYDDLLLLSPALLAADALRYSLTVNSSDTPHGTLKASYTDLLGQPVSIVVDPASGTIISVTADKEHYRYAEWRSIHGLFQPSRIEGYNGDKDAVWNDVNAAPKKVFTPEEFAIPSGYVDAKAPPNLQLASVGKGAYRVDGMPSGYHTGVVVGSDCIALFDPSVSPEEAKTVKLLVGQSFPGRQIRYIILSHVHNDHVAGLPIYFGDGVKIIAGKDAHIALRRQFPDLNLTQLQEATQNTDIDLGGTKLRLYPLDSTHASTMLVAYDSRSHTIFQGDLFYLPEIGPTPPAFDGAEELSSVISKNHLAVDTIVGVHGRSGGPKDLKDSLELRRAGRSFSTEPPITMPSEQ